SVPQPSSHVVETGPKHHQKFTAHVLVAERRLGWGNGKTKKAAEQAAARYSLEMLQDKSPDELLSWCAALRQAPGQS
ncbi:MAG: putative dsRNA-binding protein, partial [Promethearchaeia archaeon]